MAVDVEQQVIEGLRQLSVEQQHEVADFVLALIHNPQAGSTLWDKIDTRTQQVPLEAWEKVPTDGAEQHDHFLYGSPKK